MTGNKWDEPAEGGREVSRVAHEICRCPNCGYERPRPFPIPCYAVRCPRCDSPMTDL